MVRTEDACEIIKYALQNEIKVYLDGGWGVDALLKRESRIHNDIDLFVELKHYHDYTQNLCVSSNYGFKWCGGYCYVSKVKGRVIMNNLKY